MLKFRLLRRYLVPLTFASVLPFCSSSLHAQTQLPIMPLPAQVVQGLGSFSIAGGFRSSFEGHTEPRLSEPARLFLRFRILPY